jgi:antitoxin FitA
MYFSATGATMALFSTVPSIQIKDVPDDVHAVLRRRSAAEGKSLQEYLLGRLSDDAQTPTVQELFERVRMRSGGSITLKAAAREVRAERDAR